MFLVLLMIALSVSITTPQSVQLSSQLPANPIEPPDTWAWGQHPNGLGYKAKNGLSLDQCIKNPVQANTLLCTNAVKEISYWQCFKNPQVQKTQLCMRPGWF